MAGGLQLISYSGSEPPTVRGDFPKMVQALRVCADKEWAHHVCTRNGTPLRALGRASKTPRTGMMTAAQERQATQVGSAMRNTVS